MPNKEKCPKLGELIDNNLTCFSDHVELMSDHALEAYAAYIIMS